MDEPEVLQGQEPEPSKPGGWIERLSTTRRATLLVVLSVILLGGMAFLVVYAVQRYSQPEFTPPPSLDELATEYPQLGTLIQDPKLGSVYKEFLVVYEKEGEDAAYDLAKKRGLLNDRDEVRLTLELDTTDSAGLKAQLEAKGIRVTAVSGKLMDIAIPLELLTPLLENGEAADFFVQISGLEHVVRIRIPSYTSGDSMPMSSLQVDTESLGVINVPAWHAAGFTGAGVKVGILDVQGDGYQQLLGTDLPADMVARSFIDGVDFGQTGGVHGTAVCEIIHDIAPDAKLYFAVFQTDAEMQMAVDWLVSQGVQIISNSTGSTYGPKDGTSETSQVIDRTVQKGVLWVNSAGNAAEGHYRSLFTDKDGDGWHDERIRFQTFGEDSIVLNWDAWVQGDQDYDLYIYDLNDNLVASGEDSQAGPGYPSAEYVRLQAPDDYTEYYAMVKATNTTQAFVMDLFTDNGIVHPDQLVKEYSMDDGATARLSLSVGAVNWNDDALESYSSQGPTNDGRLKPDISAPTNVSSAAYGETWNGTSAATPHVSGVAALLLQADPNLTVQQLKDYLFTHSLDLGNPGVDDQFGYGRLLLGDPGETLGVNLQPTPGTQPTEAAIIGPQATGTQPAPTISAGPTDTPLPSATARPTATLMPVVGTVTPSFSLGLLVIAGIVVMGGLGLGGIGLVAVVLVRARPPRRAEPVRLPPPASPAAQIRCPNCGTLNGPTAHFCLNCGHALSQRMAVPQMGYQEAYPPEDLYATDAPDRPARSLRLGPVLIAGGVTLAAMVCLLVGVFIFFSFSQMNSPIPSATFADPAPPTATSAPEKESLSGLPNPNPPNQEPLLRNLGAAFWGTPAPVSTESFAFRSDLTSHMTRTSRRPGAPTPS